MFGLSFGEFMVLMMVALVVLGPKDLPRYLRKAGEFAGRLRRMAYDLRERSGIDEVLRTEGIDRDIAEIRRLTRGELASVVTAVRSTAQAARFGDVAASPYAATQTPYSAAAPPAPTSLSFVPGISINREREYPGEGADCYGALPDTAMVYERTEAPLALADDTLSLVMVDDASPSQTGLQKADS